MNNTINYIDTNSIKWKSVNEGAEIAILRFEPGEVRALLRPRHSHPECEEVFVIEGVYEDMGTAYGAGSYLYYPPNSDHAPTSPTGCVILVISPKAPINIES